MKENGFELMRSGGVIVTLPAYGVLSQEEPMGVYVPLGAGSFEEFSDLVMLKDIENLEQQSQGIRLDRERQLQIASERLDQTITAYNRY